MSNSLLVDFLPLELVTRDSEIMSVSAIAVHMSPVYSYFEEPTLEKSEIRPQSFGIAVEILHTCHTGLL